jgi:large subunit ribosomal protein L16
MLAPKKSKYRKMQRGRMGGKPAKGYYLTFGDFGLKTLDPAWITDRQIEAARSALTRYLKRSGKIWIKVFPQKAVTKKPAEVRMGGGKGPHDGWVSVVKAGHMLFEIGGVTEKEAIESFRLAGHKLPVRTLFVKRDNTI